MASLLIPTRKWPVIAAVAFLGLVGAGQTAAQPSDQRMNSLLDVIASTVRGSLGIGDSQDTSNPAGSTIRLMGRSKPIPNMSSQDEAFKSSISLFNIVPDSDGKLNENSNKGIRDLLMQISQSVEFSDPDLTQDDRAQLQQAYAILYKNKVLGLKADDYKKYLEYQRRYDDLSNIIKGDTDANHRTSLTNQRGQVERDWGLFGRKDDIDTALGMIKSLESDDGPSLLKSWQASIATGSDLTAGDVASAFYRSEWIRVGVSSNTLPIVTLSGNAHAGTGALPPLARIAFDYTVLRAPRPALQHPFLQNKDWRTKGSFVISDGNVASTSASALVPRIVSALVIIKGVELTFSQDLPKPVVAALQEASSISVSGVTFRQDGQSGVSFQPRYLSTNNPAIIAYLVEPVPKTPDPTPGRTWSR